MKRVFETAEYVRR